MTTSDIAEQALGAMPLVARNRELDKFSRTSNVSTRLCRDLKPEPISFRQSVLHDREFADQD